MGTILQVVISLLVSLSVTALIVFIQVVRYRQFSEHPWKDVFSHKSTLIVYVLLRMAALFSLMRAIFRGEVDSAGLCVLVFLLLSFPMILERKLEVELSPVMEVIIFLFIYAGEILGEVDNYYVLVPGWDTALHTLNGFLCAAIGFSLVDMLNRSDNVGVNLSPFFLAVVAFCFSMTVGVLWEFIEFAGDTFLGFDAQKDFIVTSFHSVSLDPTLNSIAVPVEDITQTVIETASGQTFVIDGGYLDIGIKDTMKDLLVNCVGAFVFSTCGYLGKKMGKNSRLAQMFIPLVKRPADILKEKAGMNDNFAQTWEKKKKKDHNKER